jgi:hypothetical protein
MTENVTNLDLECACFASKIAEKDNPVENLKLLRGALGVLQENGIMACFIWLKAQKQKADNTIFTALRLLKNEKINPGITIPEEFSGQKYAIDQIIEWLKPVSSNLDTLFFAKDLLERTFIYAIYQAKALDQSDRTGK